MKLSRDPRPTLALLAAVATLVALAISPAHTARAAEPAVEKAAPELKLGDPAPRLATGSWIQGEPVKEFAKDKTYLVEFWATWCGPCRTSIPHLNELHKKFAPKGLVVIGQDVWEQDESLVGPFVKKMGEKMTYRVALDDKSSDKQGAMATTWMQAARAGGIPTAFLVNSQGKIAWIGHPMELKEKTIEDIMEGRYDLARAKTEQEEKLKNAEAADKAFTDFQKAVDTKEWAQASKILDDLPKLIPQAPEGAFDFLRYVVLTGQKDLTKARAMAEGLLTKPGVEPMELNGFAWGILSHPAIDNRDAATAEKLARKACQATQDGDAAILDTLARALFLGDKKDAAIATQQKAVSLLKPDSDEFKHYQSVLDSYKAGKLPAVQ